MPGRQVTTGVCQREMLERNRSLSVLIATGFPSASLHVSVGCSCSTPRHNPQGSQRRGTRFPNRNPPELARTVPGAALQKIQPLFHRQRASVSPKRILFPSWDRADRFQTAASQCRLELGCFQRRKKPSASLKRNALPSEVSAPPSPGLRLQVLLRAASPHHDTRNAWPSKGCHALAFPFSISRH